MEYIVTAVIVGLYRLSLVLASFGFVWMGHNLYIKGVFEKEGELTAETEKLKLGLKNFAPGIVFAIFGVAAFICTARTPPTFESTKTKTIGSINSSIESDKISPEYIKEVSNILPVISKATECPSLSTSEKEQLRNWGRDQEVRFRITGKHFPD